MTEEHKERIYEGVRRMVFSDEPRADVLHRMEVNGIPEAERQQMYDKARAERMSVIRHAALKQTAAGLALMLCAFGVFIGAFNFFEVVTSEILALCTLIAALGIGFFSVGLYFLLFPHNKTGSLADDK